MEKLKELETVDTAYTHENSLEKKTRVDYFDIAKGIAILCMVIGHTIKNKYILNIIFSFHMPLFFLISGYFFKKDKNVIKKGFKRLIIPYIVTAISIIAIKTLSAILTKDDIISTISKWTFAALFGSSSIEGKNIITGENIIAIGAIWFLLSLFFAQILLKVVLKIKKIKFQILILTVISGIGFILPNYIWLPFSIETSLITVIFLYIGYIVRDKKLLEKSIPTPIKLVMLLLWIVVIFQKRVGCVSNQYSLYYITILGTVCGSYFILQISKLIEKYTKYMKKILIYSGKHSLQILCIHLIDLNCIPWWKVNIRNSILMFIRIGTALIGTALIEKLKNIRKLSD